jgi:hypothetical protein
MSFKSVFGLKKHQIYIFFSAFGDFDILMLKIKKLRKYIFKQKTSTQHHNIKHTWKLHFNY